MKIDMGAVREGTRWHFLGRKVVVEGVSCGQVVFRFAPGPGVPTGVRVASCERFAAGATPAGSGEWGELLGELRMIALQPADERALAVTTCLMRDAMIHVLERLGPLDPGAPKADPTEFQRFAAASAEAVSRLGRPPCPGEVIWVA